MDGEKFTILNNNYATELTEELKNTILQDYLDDYSEHANDYTVSDVIIRGYYGTYNNCVALMIDGPFLVYTQAIRDEVIGDVVLHYNDGNSILIWNNGEFYQLKDAYEGNLISKDDLISIANFKKV